MFLSCVVMRKVVTRVGQRGRSQKCLLTSELRVLERDDESRVLLYLSGIRSLAFIVSLGDTSCSLGAWSGDAAVSRFNYSQYLGRGAIT